MQQTMQKTQEMMNHLAAVDRVLEANNNDPGRLIPILQQVQEVHKYLSEEVISYIAISLKVPPAQVYGVATFYAHFSLTPKGKYVIRLCDGTACHVKKSTAILTVLQDKLGLSDEKQTSNDLMFTVETVSCLGACGLAPVMLVNGDVHGQVTPEKALSIVQGILDVEKAK